MRVISRKGVLVNVSENVKHHATSILRVAIVMKNFRKKSFKKMFIG